MGELLFLSYIYLFCFLGALSKDLLETFLGNIEEILVMKVIVSSLAVAIVLYGGSDKILEKMACKPFTALCYIMGLVSFEVL
ncbi:hypothetical protein CLFO_34740 [Clostridium formicaceticum]|uniref:Uncharacterized protein n=1 Tax=Clostridium formicaceticum TaxID=1497 RepID=A0AAC9WHK4_9CLOT|nr:hypothetical protein CLFO_34740 [Clostridium formicaceticum]